MRHTKRFYRDNWKTWREADRQRDFEEEKCTERLMYRIQMDE